MSVTQQQQQQHSRSKTPDGVRQRTSLLPQGVNPYEPIVTSANRAEILHEGRAKVSKKIVKATSRSGRESTVLFVDEVVEGRRVLDKFRLCCIAGNDDVSGIEAALASVNPYRVQRMDGANYYMIYIEQRSYDTRACCGAFDLTWSHFFGLCALLSLGGVLVLFATKGEITTKLVL